eukprot:CAMPEP_0172713326 /NCGR_PEP_ID=MMETSP1074-20121228/62103_1 /TAXON_ID=2916 /ORGANISM="Ceratium fusus, Strain PA161109" /LENGTH=113 /DNA_ID=CAMNT_0013537397 /DNA_START=57 /DNA_END=398 /DNA_ORIENTATION=+
MAQVVNVARMFDGLVFGGFLLFVGGFGLFLVGELHKMAFATESKKKPLLQTIAAKMFPFPDNKYEFNLTHVLLFSLLIALLSMLHHPAQDIIEQQAEKQKRKREKKAKAAKGD